MSVLSRLQMIFRDVLNDQELELTAALSMAGHAEWDSVATVNLVFAIQDEFGVRFTPEEVGSIHSVQDILSLLEAYEAT